LKKKFLKKNFKKNKEETSKRYSICSRFSGRNNYIQFFLMAVLHEGTVIWRCFKSNRFSEDLDFYLEKKRRGKNKKVF